MKRLLAPLVLLAGACNAGPDQPGRMYMPEMVVSTPYDAHDRNPVLARGQTLQAPPEGAVPRGHEPFHYGASAEEAAAADELVNPMSEDADTLARGRRGYETFCAVCHGRGGDGDGTVVPPFPNPPSLKAERATLMSDGRMFHVITRGQGFMPAYAAQMPADDRWRVVVYIRELQGGRRAAAEDGPVDAPAEDVPAEDVPGEDAGVAAEVPSDDAAEQTEEAEASDEPSEGSEATPVTPEAAGGSDGAD